MNTVNTAGNSGLARWAGWISILQGLVLFIPLFVLGAAINWPESLSDPAETAYQRDRPYILNDSAARNTFHLAPTPWKDILDGIISHYRHGN
jgi:hypothetical protein